MWFKKHVPETKAKAVAYYRHSMQDSQENSVPIQREQIRQFAKAHGIEIIAEFADYGESGLSTEGRDNFERMLELVVDSSKEFHYILVLDVSRWGRFQDIDQSAYYRAFCKKYGREVVYTTIGLPKTDDPMHFMQINFEAFRAASYSRELSVKVFRGCAKIAEQGFRAGAAPPYGLYRLLLDEARQPVQILKPGQRKSIHNQRVTLAPGDEDQQAVIRRIFEQFVNGKRSPQEITESLNSDGIPSPGRRQWSESAVSSILSNEFYIGTMVYNKTTSRLQAPTRRNPEELWIRTRGAFDAVVDKGLFSKAQEIIRKQQEQYERLHSREDMLAKLSDLYKKYGVIRAKQIAASKDMLSAHAYARKFNSLDMAYQNMFEELLQRTKAEVMKWLNGKVKQVEEYNDYLVLNESFSLLVQPSVPVPYGYGAYWSFCPDPRVEVDVTLGVLLSDSKHYDVIGYLFFPRLLVPCRSIRIFSSSDAKLELYGSRDMGMIEAILC